MKKFEKPLEYVKKIQSWYEKETGKTFFNLVEESNEWNKENQEKKQICCIDLALEELLDKILLKKSDETILFAKEKELPLLSVMNRYYQPSKINLDAKIEELSIDDMVNLHNCLSYSQYDKYLLIHYNEIGIWTNSCIPRCSDRWNIYDEFLKECRSVILDLKTMKIISLPFAKFRNLNESEDYSLTIIQEKIKDAKLIEFADKLDGSFIQMRYIADKNLWNGILVSTSGSVNSFKNFHLQSVLKWLNKFGENYRKFCNEYSDYTCIFEWIHPTDKHIVSYDESQIGLHLVGMRNVKTGELKSYKEIITLANTFELQCTTLYSETLNSILSKLDDFESTEKEGWVLNIDGFLVKIKCNEFTEMFKIIQDSSSFNTILRCYTNNTLDDIIAKVPESCKDFIYEKVNKIVTSEQKFFNVIDKYTVQIPVNLNRKEVIDWIKKQVPKKLQPYVIAKYVGKSIEFLVRHKDTNCPSYLKEKEIDNWLEYLQKLE